MSRPIDLSVYLVTAGTGRDVVDVASAAARGGASVVQVRAKELEGRALLDLVTSVADAVAAVDPAVRVLVDDRVDVAWAARRRGASVHGVHLGQGDLPVADARALLGPEAIIGLTTGTLDLVRAANELAEHVDYVGAGPFRLTPTKDSGRPPLGLDGYPAIVAASRVPVVAIGDVTCADVGALRGTGVAGVALVREIVRAADPEAATRAVRAAWDAGRA